MRGNDQSEVFWWSVAGVAGIEGAPDLLDSFNFFSLSAYVVRTAEKFCYHRDNR